MKKTLLLLAMASLFTMAAPAQEVLKEIEKTAKAIKNDTTKDLTTRRVASFKVDAITYLRQKVTPSILTALNSNPQDMKSYNENIKLLNEQALAMYEYVNLYIRRLDDSKKKNRAMVTYFFQQATVENSLFHDTDTEYVLSWFNRPDYLVPFSLDCNWKKALAFMRNVDWSDK